MEFDTLQGLTRSIILFIENIRRYLMCYNDIANKQIVPSGIVRGDFFISDDFLSYQAGMFYQLVQTKGP